MKNIIILSFVVILPLAINLYLADCLALFFLLESVHIAALMNPGHTMRKIYARALIYIESLELSTGK